MSLLDALLARLQRSAKLKLAWITSDLAISRAPMASEWPIVERAGVRGILDLREASVPDSAPTGSTLTYVHIPVEEYAAPTAEAMERATEWIAESIVRGPVLIHCREGIGRSPLIACAALVRLGIPLSDAYELLHRARIRVVFSDQQIAAIDAFAARRDAQSTGRTETTSTPDASTEGQ